MECCIFKESFSMIGVRELFIWIVKIGKVIAKRRKEKGMTQGELAERLSVSNKTISKWETGVGLPDISILVDLASALDISVDDLLKGKENKVQNALCEKNFLIKKKYYKKYLRDHFLKVRLIGYSIL